LFAFHCAGVKARTAATRPLVALVAVADLSVEVVDQWLQRGLVGRRHPGLCLGRVGGELRNGGRGGVVGVGRNTGGGEHQHADAVVAEDRPEVVRGLLHRGVVLDRVVELLQRRNAVAEDETKLAWPAPSPWAALALARAACRSLTRSLMSVVALALMPARVVGTALLPLLPDVVAAPTVAPAVPANAAPEAKAMAPIQLSRVCMRTPLVRLRLVGAGEVNDRPHR
jgi:hypothetical protein